MECDLLEPMTSISFDRAASFYDETRSFPPGVADLVAASAQSHLPPHARLLECGIGTGRIALPLMRQGLQVTGLDLSRKMMQRLIEGLEPDLPQPVLIQGDVTQLPLRSGWFDVVLMVHVIHLISDWQKALTEVRQALKPDGSFMTGFNYHPGGSLQEQVREKWREIVHQYHQGSVELGHHRFEQVKAYLSKEGTVLDEWKAASWSKSFQVGGFIDSLEKKIYSSTWNIPDDIYQRSIDDLRAWAVAEFGSLDYAVQQPHEFIWQRFRWK